MGERWALSGRLFTVRVVVVDMEGEAREMGKPWRLDDHARASLPIASIHRDEPSAIVTARRLWVQISGGNVDKASDVVMVHTYRWGKLIGSNISDYVLMVRRYVLVLPMVSAEDTRIEPPNLPDLPESVFAAIDRLKPILMQAIGRTA